MGMVIHDDFWAAAQAMPEKQRAPFIYAIVEYRFTGKEPQGSPAWLPTFLVLKGSSTWATRRASAQGRRPTPAGATGRGRKTWWTMRRHGRKPMRKHMREHMRMQMQSHMRKQMRMHMQAHRVAAMQRLRLRLSI